MEKLASSCYHMSHWCTTSFTLSAHSADIPEVLSTEFNPTDLDLDCLSDCGYTVGINFHGSLLELWRQVILKKT